LNERASLKEGYRFFRPRRVLEHDIGIQPSHVTAFTGEVAQRNVEETFLLPHDVAITDSDENFSIIVFQFEVPAHGVLDDE